MMATRTLSSLGAVETAGFHVSTNVPNVAPSMAAGDIREWLRGQRFESLAALAVCEDGKLVGLLKIEDLMAARDNAAASELMDADPPVVAPGIDQEVAAFKATKRGESTLAVVDAERRFLGFIPPHRLLGVLLQEHEEDLDRLSGILRGTAEARSASEEPLRPRLKHRLPWLILGLAGAVGSAQVVGGFEETLQAHLALAFFLPGIVYLADAVGTQTETVVVRGLSLGIPISKVAWQESLTGLIGGIILGALFLPAALLLWGDSRIAATVAISLFAACFIATVVGLALPWALSRLGRDPAFGTGPLSTVIQDLCSIVIYLGTARLLVS